MLTKSKGDCLMRILTTQERIDLGLAEKQASDLIISRHWSSLKEDFFEEYKALARKFLKANKELNSEIAEAGDSDNNSHSAPEPQKAKKAQPLPNKLPTELDDKHKHCPRCREPILKSWMRHDKCGWVA